MRLLKPAIAGVTTSMLIAVSGSAIAQSGKDLVGGWTLVSADTVKPDGSRTPTFGPTPQGLLIFDAGGRYSLQICRAGRAKFASGSRVQGTPDEYKEAVQGCNPHWGRYSVNDEDRAIVFKIEYAMYPNWEGIEQKRRFTIAGDQLKYTVPAASGGGTAEVVWQRAK
jgi:Lipocalin-like domain